MDAVFWDLKTLDVYELNMVYGGGSSNGLSKFDPISKLCYNTS